MAGGRGDPAVEHVDVLDLIASPQLFDDTLEVTAAFAIVLDEVEVFVGSDILDADNHGVEPDGPQARVRGHGAYFTVRGRTKLLI
jgi:hypothetical protein